MAGDSAFSDPPTVADIAGRIGEVVDRFVSGQTHPFSFGDGVPEAVIASFDQYDDLGGTRRSAGTVPCSLPKPWPTSCRR
jgi:hypothetical protein